MLYGYINKIIPFSSVDGPGNRTVIFLQGCNFNCVYCHNPETINKCKSCGNCITSCKSGALKNENNEIIWSKEACAGCDECIKNCNNNSTPKVLKMTVDDIIDEISQYKSFIQGITVSGGECTLQKDFLIELFKRVKELGLTCFIDSNGSSDFQELDELLELCDGVMLDLKVWDNSKHNKYIQFNNSNVIKNLHYLKDKHKLYEVRTVVVPEIFNNEETVENVSKIIGEDTHIRYKLIKFRSTGVRLLMKDKKSPTDDLMEKLKSIAIANKVENILIV